MTIVFLPCDEYIHSGVHVRPHVRSSRRCVVKMAELSNGQSTLDCNTRTLFFSHTEHGMDIFRGCPQRGP